MENRNSSCTQTSNEWSSAMSKQSEAGKGSAPRKQQDQEKYEEGWDRIFGKKK